MVEKVDATVADKSVMLAAGGTGGHLFPAFALAEELTRRGIVVDLMTDHRGDRYGTGFPARTIYAVPSATFTGRSPLAMLRTGWTLARGIVAARRILARVAPAAVVGFGGYPSFPPLIAARSRGIPAVLHEQNAVLGRANRFLTKYVNAIATSFEPTRFLDAPEAGKARLTGNPVRQIVIDQSKRPYVASAGAAEFRLVVFGGSQGARYFSDVVPPALALLPADLTARLQLVQQCREEDMARVEAAYAAAGIAATLAPFFTDLPERLSQAHLVIGRAGASSVAELGVLGRPSILVPLPHALDNDQLQNATRLAESGASWCFAQHTLTPERLAGELERLMRAPEALAAAAAAAKRQGRPDAVMRLADLVETVMGRMVPARGESVDADAR